MLNEHSRLQRRIRRCARRLLVHGLIDALNMRHLHEIYGEPADSMSLLWARWGPSITLCISTKSTIDEPASSA
jgi:hypothetical protein